MLLRLSLSAKAHFLFVRVTTKVEISLVTEKLKYMKSGWPLIRCLMVCSQLYLHRSEVVKSESYTETGKILVHYAHN